MTGASPPMAAEGTVELPPVSPDLAPTGESLAEGSGEERRIEASRIRVFWLQIVYLAVLGAIGYVSAVATDGNPVPAAIGLIPTGALWFGALGGILISLTGVFEHSKDWDPKFWPWHVSRPLVGAALAAVAVVALQSGVLAIGSKPPEAGTSSFLFYYLIAFIVGFREESFRDLMRRMADVLLKPATEEKKPPDGGA